MSLLLLLSGPKDVFLDVTFTADSSLSDVLHRERAISASMQSDAELTGSILADRDLVSSFEATSSLEGQVQLDSPISVSFEADSLFDPLLDSGLPLDAEFIAESSLEGTITGGVLLDILLSADTTLSDALNKELATEVDFTIDSSFDPILVEEVDLQAELLGDGSLSGQLQLERPLSADFISESMMSVVLSRETDLPSVSWIADGILSGELKIAIVAVPGFISPAPPYRVVILDLEGTPLAQVPFQDLNYSFALNDSGTVSFNLPKYHPKCIPTLMTPGQREIIIYREVEPVWGGYLWTGSPSTDNEKVAFTGEGWFSRLYRRVVDEELKLIAMDQLELAWQLIAYTQGKPSGDLGIIRDNPAESSAVPRTRRYFPHEMAFIGDEIRSMTEASTGFDFEITPTKRWKTYFPQRGVNLGLLFEMGKNIETVSYTDDATEVVSEMITLGAGDGRNRCVAILSDATSLSDYGLLQDVEDRSDVKHYDTLYAINQGSLQARKKRLIQPDLTVVVSDPPFGYYNIGDISRVKVDDGYIQLNEDFRIVAQTVRVNDEMYETQQLMMDRGSV